ncbi:hypothetical protein J3A83DRAFT_2524335 [Scleroderma citrinum]
MTEHDRVYWLLAIQQLHGSKTFIVTTAASHLHTMASWQRILFGKNEADTRKADSYRSTPTRRSSSLGLNPDGTSMPLSSRTNMQISGSEVENVTDKPHTLGTQHRPNQPSPRGTYPVAKTPSSHGDQNNASDVETPTFHGTSRHSGTQIQVSKTPNPPHSQGFDVARSLARSGGFNDVQKITTERRSSASCEQYWYTITSVCELRPY